MGLTYCDGRKRKHDKKISYSDVRLSVTFSGVSSCDNRERVFMFDYDTKEKEN
jgi:hypothetical protein